MSRAKVSARLVEEADLPMLLQWRNHSRIRDFMFSQDPISSQEHYSWFYKSKKDPLVTLLVLEEGNQPFGFAQLTFQQPREVASWGFYVSPDAIAGSGLKLGRVVLRHAFFELCAHKVFGEVLESNEASIKLHNKLGFVFEGELRQHKLVAGAFRSVKCFGLLSTEYSELSQEELE